MHRHTGKTPSRSKKKRKNGVFFTLKTVVDENETHIVMKMQTHIVNTRDLPQTVRILKKCCPGVLKTQCFNEEHLPFDQEVTATEIGHLFEHILLECLCLRKIALGAQSASYNGHTDWNWKKERWGTFHIFIDAGKDVGNILQDSIVQASDYTQLILQTAQSRRHRYTLIHQHKQAASLIELPVVHPSINLASL